MRLLLVEDDPKIASFITKGFTSAGFAVDHAADGEQGLHLATTEPYDTAVIDIMLPKLDGLALIERMRKVKINTFGFRGTGLWPKVVPWRKGETLPVPPRDKVWRFIEFLKRLSQETGGFFKAID